MKPPSFDINLFDTLNNHSAYFIGIVSSDGCVWNNSVRISLIDKELIEKIHYSFNQKTKIYLVDKTNSKYNCKQQFLTMFTNKKLVEFLKTYGVTNNKTKTLTVHNSLKNNKHFWRGMIDGDGTVSLTTRPNIRLCGTIDVCTEFLNFVNNQITKTSAKIHIKKSLENFAEVYFGYRVAYKICKYLYDDLSENDLFLERKFKIAKQIINHYENIDKEKNNDFEKRCTCCKIKKEKSTNNFYFRNDKFDYMCKECRRNCTRKRRKVL